MQEGKCFFLSLPPHQIFQKFGRTSYPTITKAHLSSRVFYSRVWDPLRAPHTLHLFQIADRLLVRTLLLSPRALTCSIAAVLGLPGVSWAGAAFCPGCEEPQLPTPQAHSGSGLSPCVQTQIQCCPLGCGPGPPQPLITQLKQCGC